MYIQTADDGTIKQVITVGVMPETNGYEIDRGSISDDILRNIFQYKYINGEFIKNDSFLDTKINEIKRMKIANMSSICNQYIVGGIDLNGEHYSLTPNDQVNLMKLESIATLSPDTPLFYHPDGGLCRSYSSDEIKQLASLATLWVTYHTTYFNFLKAQLSVETDVDKIINFQYGDTLNEEFSTRIQQIASGIDLSNIPVILDDVTTYHNLCATVDLDKLMDEPTEPVDEPIDEDEGLPDPVVEETVILDDNVEGVQDADETSLSEESTNGAQEQTDSL